jgi:hypothetical protein
VKPFHIKISAVNASDYEEPCESIAAKISRNRSKHTGEVPLSSCRQIRITVHPRSFSCSVTRWSRALLVRTRFSQNSAFVFGTEKCSLQPCQKRPSKKNSHLLGKNKVRPAYAATVPTPAPNFVLPKKPNECKLGSFVPATPIADMICDRLAFE